MFSEYFTNYFKNLEKNSKILYLLIVEAKCSSTNIQLMNFQKNKSPHQIQGNVKAPN